MQNFVALVVRTLVLATFVLTTSGCALMFRGSTENLTIYTSPSDAKIELSNGHACRSPCTSIVKRRHKIEALVSKRGCETQSVQFSRKAQKSSWFFGGVAYPYLLTGSLTYALSAAYGGGGSDQTMSNLLGAVFFIGIPVDLITGAMLSHHPNPLVVSLECPGETVMGTSESD